LRDANGFPLSSFRFWTAESFLTKTRCDG